MGTLSKLLPATFSTVATLASAHVVSFFIPPAHFVGGEVVISTPMVPATYTIPLETTA